MASCDREGSSDQPIIIPDDPQSSIGREVEDIVQQIQRSDSIRLNTIELLGDDNDSSSSSSTEDGDSWAQIEADYDQEIQKIESIDLTQDEDDEDDDGEKTPRKKADPRCQHYQRGVRNPCLCGAYDEVTEHVLDNDRKLKIRHVYGVTEEICVGRFLVDFIEINSIWVHRITHAVRVRGLAYTRTRNLDGRVQAYQNEVCQVLQIDTNDPRPIEEQAALEATVAQVHPEPRILHKTNKPFPECRFELVDYRDKEDREIRAPLICRWQHTMHYPDRRYRRAQRPVDGEVLRHFVEEDIRKKRHRGSDAERLTRWRGSPRIRGGSYIPLRDDLARATEGVLQGDNNYIRVFGQKYTAADMFSGAGGVSTGAKAAGFEVLLAVDHWPRCNATYKANHPEVDLHEVDIMEFCNDLTDDDEQLKMPQLDLIHLSPPCQTWSPAHTVMGRNDPANIAALSACQHIVHKHRPRLVTFEQTFGIVHERHLPYFNALVQSLTRYGYSLQWRVFPLVQFGLPQNRKRLLMIGAAPGETLPTWPKPTHSEDPMPFSGQRPYVSAIKACRMLREGVKLHDVDGAKELRPYREPWDGEKPMNRTITTSGGQSYHWDGERELTLAEFARLQGFPCDYTFVGPCIKKQIGNAFPPCVVKTFMRHLRKHLEALDRIVDDINFISLEDDGSDDNDDDDDDIDDDGSGQQEPIALDDDDIDQETRNWWATKKKVEEGDEEVPKCMEWSPEQAARRFDKFAYVNGGLSADEAWIAAIEESKRDERRGRTSDSSVTITDTRQLLTEVMRDDDGDEGYNDTLMPDLPSADRRRREADHHQTGRELFDPFFSSLLGRPSSPTDTRQENISPFALPPRMTGNDGALLSASSFSRPSLPLQRPPQLRRQDSTFFETEGYVEIFPHGAARTSPGQSYQSPFIARPSSSSSNNNNNNNNRGSSPLPSSSAWPSLEKYQGNMSEAEALAAALRASMQEPDVAHRAPSAAAEQSEPERECSPIPEEALAEARQFFGPWNPPAASPGQVEGDEDEPYVGKGKGKAMARRQVENKDEEGEGEGKGKGKEEVTGGTAGASTQAVDEDGDVEMGENDLLQQAIAMSMAGLEPRDDGEGDEEKAAVEKVAEEEEGGKGKGKGKPDSKRPNEFEDDEGSSPAKKGRMCD